MLRSVRHGLSAVVLAAVVGGTVAWSSVDKSVTLVVDGHPTHVHTTASRVADVLGAAGYDLGGHDLVAPAANAAVHNGSTIVYRQGRLLHLDVDGTRKDVWTTAPTVSDALEQLGYSTEDFTSVSRARRLALNPTDITVRTPRPVAVVHDGQTQRVRTTDATVGQLLGDLGIVLGPKDRLSATAVSALHPNQKIVVRRVKTAHLSTTKALPFPTTTTSDPTLEVGRTQLIAPGADGAARRTYSVVYVDGTVAGKTLIKTVVVRAPKPRIVKVGTKPRPMQAPTQAPVPAPAPSQAPSPAPAPIAVTPGSAQAIGRALAAARGWGAAQFSCLVQLWDHESGWRVAAADPSGAYGIPQALPGSKMSSAGSNWQTDAATQIRWGLGYIAASYGTPCGAWSSWQAQGWY